MEFAALLKRQVWSVSAIQAGQVHCVIRNLTIPALATSKFPFSVTFLTDKRNVWQMWDETMWNPTDFFSLFSIRCLHGKCIATNSAYTCKCIEGYAGMHCDRKNDSSNSCRFLKCNHGQCKISAQGEPYCECDPSYSGERCDRGWCICNMWYVICSVPFTHLQSNAEALLMSFHFKENFYFTY